MNFDNDGGAKGGSNVHTKLFLVENYFSSGKQERSTKSSDPPHTQNPNDY